MKWQFARVQQKEIYTKYIVQRVLSNETISNLKFHVFESTFALTLLLGADLCIFCWDSQKIIPIWLQKIPYLESAQETESTYMWFK